LEDNSFDVVISNSVINLIPDKIATLKETMRVLKPGGCLRIANQIAIGPVEKDLKARIDSWFQ
jgi:ubiquinone/menaquinone biosynthesis C-methylase UbiE